MNITSLVVDVRPEHLRTARDALLHLPGVEIHAATEAGKLVVTVDAESDSETVATFERIGAVEGVMSCAMVFHQIEPNPDEEASHGADAT